MNDDYYFPNAFFAFQTDLLKYEVRNIIAPIAMRSLRLPGYSVNTPWKINLFLTKEFEKYSIEDIPKAIEELRFLNGSGAHGQNEIKFMSPHEINLSRHNAQMLLNENPNARLVVKRAKEMSLNYIIQGVFTDTSYSRVKYEQDTKAYEALKDIVAKLTNTEIARNINEFKRQFYLYAEDGELQIIFP